MEGGATAIGQNYGSIGVFENKPTAQWCEGWSGQLGAGHPQGSLSRHVGLLQIATGLLSDRWGRKGLIVAGMWVQAATLFLTALADAFRSPGAHPLFS